MFSRIKNTKKLIWFSLTFLNFFPLLCILAFFFFRQIYLLNILRVLLNSFLKRFFFQIINSWGTGLNFFTVRCVLIWKCIYFETTSKFFLTFSAYITFFPSSEMVSLSKVPALWPSCLKFLTNWKKCFSCFF